MQNMYTFLNTTPHSRKTYHATFLIFVPYYRWIWHDGLLFCGKTQDREVWYDGVDFYCDRYKSSALRRRATGARVDDAWTSFEDLFELFPRSDEKKSARERELFYFNCVWKLLNKYRKLRSYMTPTNNLLYCGDPGNPLLANQTLVIASNKQNPIDGC
jgi:hypothetical protein